MIAKHIDLVAIGVLLAGIGLFNGAKQVLVMTMGGPVHYFRIDRGHEVEMPEMPRVPQVPPVPRVPPIPMQND